MRYLSKAKRFEAVQAYVLYFFFYSVLGWLYEVFLEVVVYRWGFTNRGVLLGPYCPVYGVGALVFLLCFSRLMAKREPSWIRWAKPVLVFLGCMITATAIELATSYILEALTGAWPWQTYLDYCLPPSDSVWAACCSCMYCSLCSSGWWVLSPPGFGWRPRVQWSCCLRLNVCCCCFDDLRLCSNKKRTDAVSPLSAFPSSFPDSSGCSGRSPH